MSELVLETDRLTKRYRGRLAVSELSLRVERGDVFGFLGPNGAGKSTTIRIALGLIRPTSGSVKLLGYDIAKDRAKALSKVGAIVESPAFYDNLSAIQNLKMLSAMSGGASAAYIEEVLEIVGLRGRENDPVRIYSQGMRQRLGIAQALLPRPEVIILDEPTDGLDPQGIRQVRELILKLRNEIGLTVFLSSHLLYEVEQICNRVAILNQGQMLFQGPVDELLEKEKTVKVTVDRVEEAEIILRSLPFLTVHRNGDGSLHIKTDDRHIAQVNKLLVSNGIRVSELAQQRRSLEDVFIHLTKTQARS